MKITVKANGVETILGYSEIEGLFGVIEDCEKNAEFFSELSESESVSVRSRLASLKHILPSAMQLLIQDKYREVMSSIVENNSSTPYLKKSDLERYIETGDTEILTSIAYNIGRFTEEYDICDLNWLCEKLSNSVEPIVRHILSENEHVPMYVLLKLSEDDDIDIATTALESIAKLDYQELEEEEDDDDNQIVTIEDD